MARRFPFLLAVAGALICASSFLLDNPVIAWVRAHPNGIVRQLSRFFTKWGDFPPICVLLLLLLLAAWLMKRPFFTRVILLMLGSSIVCGLLADLIRLLTGRARPNAHAAPGWYGFKDHGRWIAGTFPYSSFPSAHTAVAIACIVPLWIFLSWRQRLFIALPATLLAASIAASRILLNDHHLSDVLAASWLSIIVSSLICARFPPRTAQSPRNQDVP